MVNEFERAEGFPSGSCLNVFIFESAGTLSTTIKNGAGSGATGIFQVMPKTANDLGYTIAQVEQMTFQQQLELFKKYLTKNGYYQKLKTTKDQLDFYLAVLYPALMGKADTAIMARSPSITYNQNSGLDGDKNGVITKADIRRYFYRNVDRYRRNNNLEPVTITATLDTFLPLLILAAFAFKIVN